MLGFASILQKCNTCIMDVPLQGAVVRYQGYDIRVAKSFSLGQCILQFGVSNALFPNDWGGLADVVTEKVWC